MENLDTLLKSVEFSDHWACFPFVFLAESTVFMIMLLIITLFVLFYTRPSKNKIPQITPQIRKQAVRTGLLLGLFLSAIRSSSLIGECVVFPEGAELLRSVQNWTQIVELPLFTLLYMGLGFILSLIFSCHREFKKPQLS